MNDLPDSRIAKLVARFEAIGAARMIHLPFYRQDLAVEAVGFRALESYFAGVLITPWFINLVLLPRDPDATPVPHDGAEVFVELPGGRQRLLANQDEELGGFLTFSVASNLFTIADQTAAREQAQASVKRWLETPQPKAPAKPGPADRRRFLRTLMGE